MNEEAYKIHFESLSDSKLNDAIWDLVKMKCESRNSRFEKMGILACREWDSRHPGTIAPCIHERAMEKGGFPSCYSGPTETIILDKE